MATNPMIIPIAERYAELRGFLAMYVDVVATIRDGNPNLAQQFPQFFLFLVYPWLVDRAPLSQDQTTFLERRQREIEQLKFDGETARKQLEEILGSDKHLAECCPNPLYLANFLDTFFITPVADAKRQGMSKERLDFAYDEFDSLTYHQGRFKRIALSHVFNLDMEGNSEVLEALHPQANIRIERLDANTIPGILGESGFQAFLHPAGVGDCFIVEEEGASSADDFQWLIEKQRKAFTFVQVLQYFQDGVVHLGYSVPVFQPGWANQIRRTGLFFLGEARRRPYENGTKPYRIVAAERERLGMWWRGATSEPIAGYLANKKGKLRQSIYRAGQYYESSHERADSVERMLALAIALESLFSPSDRGELKFRICQSAAQFVGTTPSERDQTFASISKLYDRRSALVHGTYNVDDYDAGTFVTAGEIENWASVVRRALLGFLTIYFRGNKEAARDPILQQIAACNFDDTKGAELRESADMHRFFAGITPS
jgi:hypothetical protein